MAITHINREDFNPLGPAIRVTTAFDAYFDLVEQGDGSVLMVVHDGQGEPEVWETVISLDVAERDDLATALKGKVR